MAKLLQRLMEHGGHACPRPGLATGECQPLSDTVHAEAHYAQKPFRPPTSNTEETTAQKHSQKIQSFTSWQRQDIVPCRTDEVCKLTCSICGLRASMLPSAPPQLPGPMFPYIFSAHTPAMLGGATGTPQLLYLFRGKPEADAA